MFQQFKKIIPFFVLIVFVVTYMLPIAIQAQTTSGTSGGNPTTSGSSGSSGSSKVTKINIENPFKCSGNSCTIPGFIKSIVENILMPIGGVVAVLMIMWAGFLYVTAGGNETQIKKAHEALTWAMIGAAILLGAWVISGAIQGTINELSKP